MTDYASLNPPSPQGPFTNTWRGGGAGCKMKFSSRIFQGPSLNLKNSWGSNLLADENKGKPHALGFNSTSWMSIEKLQCEKVLPPPPRIECTNLPNPRTFADAGRIGLTSGSVSLLIASSCPSGPMNLLVTAGMLKKMCKWEFYYRVNSWSSPVLTSLCTVQWR